jgi:hypothetical protein
MLARTFWSTLVAVGLLLSVAAPALADEPVSPVQPVETTTVQAPPPTEAPPPKPIPEIDERTAYMTGKHTLKLGILAFEYGILQQLSIGTAPPAWVLRSIISVLVPNLHLKYQILDRDPVAVAVLGAGYYADISTNDINGHLFAVPVSLFVSVKVHPRITLHGEGTYIYARVTGTGDITKASLDGASAASAGQVGLMAQFRLTRIFSLTATGRYQFWVSDLPLSATTMTDPYTTGSLSGQFVPAVQHPWEAIGGIAVLWRYFHLIAGAGYGYYFVPGLDIANTKKTFVPDLSLAVVL